MGNKIVSTKKAKKLTSAELRKKKKDRMARRKRGEEVFSKHPSPFRSPLSSTVTNPMQLMKTSEWPNHSKIGIAKCSLSWGGESRGEENRHNKRDGVAVFCLLV